MKLLNQFRNNKLLKTGAKYSVASTCSAVCTMIVGFLNMRWLGPELLGVWQSVTIVNSYLPIFQLGIQSGLNLELPILLGANRKDDANRLVSTALSYAIMLASLLFIVSVCVIVFLFLKGTDLIVIGSAISVSIMAILSCFKLHYIATYRSANAFDRLTNIFWVDCITTLLLIVLIYCYGYYGLLLCYVIKDIIHTALLYLLAPYRSINPKFQKASFLILLRRGVFMTVFNEIKGIIESTPKIILLKLGGTIQVGLFNPALVVGGCLNLIPNQIAQFLHPQLGYKYGESHKAKDNWNYLRTLFVYVPICLIPAVIIAWFSMPIILEYCFPKYMDSLGPIRVMLIGYMFSTTYFSRGFLITIKAYVQVIMLQLVDLFFFIAMPVLFVSKLNIDILMSLSIALSVAYFITYIIAYFSTRKILFCAKYNKEDLND